MPAIPAGALNHAIKTASHRANRGPLWEGPCGSGPQGGVTQSMLAKFLVCRERFRCYVVKGLRERGVWNRKTGYGDMWHVCEEHFAKVPAKQQWQHRVGEALQAHCQKECLIYPMQRQEIEHWFKVCQIQFPEYVKYWAKHPQVKNRKPLYQEKTFDVPYKLPSGRIVRLRGKWDSVDLIGTAKNCGIWLQENKSKGNPDERQIKRQLTFDLQTMMYMVALAHSEEIGAMPGKLAGVRYNVIRRPLSGGKGTIKQHEPTKGSKCPKCKAVNSLRCPKCKGVGRIGAKPGESSDAFYSRLLNDYIAKTPAEYFMRWEVEVSTHDIQRFKTESFDPILEQLCMWWEWVALAEKSKPDHPFRVAQNGLAPHFRMPFGVYSPLLDAKFGATDLDEHLVTGSEVGLQRVDTLFKELEAA